MGSGNAKGTENSPDLPVHSGGQRGVDIGLMFFICLICFGCAASLLLSASSSLGESRGHSLAEAAGFSCGGFSRCPELEP